MKEIIVVANGPSLNKIPRSFLDSRETLMMNVGPKHLGIKPKYWTAWDTWSMAEMVPMLSCDIWINTRQFDSMKNIVPARGARVNWWRYMVSITGVPFNATTGCVFTTTTHSALVLAGLVLGYQRILLVGFDCTVGHLHDNAHFYNPDKESHYNPLWDEQAGAINRHLYANGVDVVNLSPGTMCKSLKKGNVRDYE